MEQVLAFLRKEFRQLRRDPRMLFLLIVPPIVQLVLLGYAANLDVRHVPLVVCDPVPSATSRELVQRLVASTYFDLVGYEPDARRVGEWLDRGQATVALVFPPDFGKDVAQGATASVQLLVDGSETNTATVALSYASQIIQHALGAGTIPAGVVPELRVWFNPALSSRWFIIPGLVGLLLTVMTTVLTALALVKEKETGTLEQLLVTPLRPATVLLGKLVPFLLIGLLDVLLVVLVATLWFQVPLRGSIPSAVRLRAAFSAQHAGARAAHLHAEPYAAAGTDRCRLFRAHAHDHPFRLRLPHREHATRDPGRHLHCAPALLSDHRAGHFPERRGHPGALGGDAGAACAGAGIVRPERLAFSAAASLMGLGFFKAPPNRYTGSPLKPLSFPPGRAG
nr:MAG: hypothetical protein KatS3mg041_0336 [Bacteroidota bacterium]